MTQEDIKKILSKNPQEFNEVLNFLSLNDLYELRLVVNKKLNKAHKLLVKYQS